MKDEDYKRVIFLSENDLANGWQLTNAENILNNDFEANSLDINDILELYSIKRYLDSGIYLQKWSPEEIEFFKDKAQLYGKIIGNFFSSITDDNLLPLYKEISPYDYKKVFFEIINKYNTFKRLSSDSFLKVLYYEPFLIYHVLTHKNIVSHYDETLKDFLVKNPYLATEILISAYEIKSEFSKNEYFIPKNLTNGEKEIIIDSYLDNDEANLNYVRLIQQSKLSTDLKISDKTRLKAKRLNDKLSQTILASSSSIQYGTNITFNENLPTLKEGFIDDNYTAHFSYNSAYIKNHNDSYSLFRNFILLFEFLDKQNRITLLTQEKQMGIFERIMGIQSKHEYRVGMGFHHKALTSHAQIVSYSNILKALGTSIEEVIHLVYTQLFHQKYNYADNAKFSSPTKTLLNLEKIRVIAPEFESILKQFKLFVEDGNIDFELLQMSSVSTAIKDIPSLNPDKYLYANLDNNAFNHCSHLLFSDQSYLAYLPKFSENKYENFFNLLINETVNLTDYEEYHKAHLDYLIANNLVVTDSAGYTKITNLARVIILKDLYYNEFGSFYHYDTALQKEARIMEQDNLIYFGSTLFSKMEQSYFNYYLNKSEFTNGLDLRNSYLHGTQVNSSEEFHEFSYFTYLKLLILVMLKIEDDLQIWIDRI